MSQKTITLKIKRQELAVAKPYWEEFHLPYRPYMNVISCLQDIQKNPKTFDGRRTTPVAWEQSCLEEVCGSCSMVINGRVRQACSALVDHLGNEITIEPMRKFPVVRDLVVRRTMIFERFKQVRAWVDGSSHESGPGPKIGPETALMRYHLSECMACGCCMDACPQVNERSDFIGPAAINQARLFNTHPIGGKQKQDRLLALMGEGGIEDCGNAQNCVKSCPKSIPLVTSIIETNRDITMSLVNKAKGLFRKHE